MSYGPHIFHGCESRTRRWVLTMSVRVDCFCIVQDDESHKHTQLRTMASIYANAYFTIAACEGTDGDHGLPGVGPHRPRKDPFVAFDFSPQCRMITTKLAGASYYWGQRYHTRAWTYQEWHLSKRILAFHNQTVSWMCRKSNWQENAYETDTLYSPYFYRDVFQRYPDLDNYRRHIHQYITRSLTYPEDGLEAFWAIIASAGRSMRGGILFGHPEMIFDAALLWRPSNSSTRRRDAHGNILKKLRVGRALVGLARSISICGTAHTRPSKMKMVCIPRPRTRSPSIQVLNGIR